MSYASLAVPMVAPLLDPALVASVRRGWARLAAFGVFAVQSVAFAAAMWLIVAGPGLLAVAK